MEQNRLRELILSMRKSKHNMIKKAENFALAVLDKGSIDMDTHELTSLIKDTFTKRRAKTFYADKLSGVIGESDGAGEAPTFACNKVVDENTVPSTWTLGSEVTFDYQGSTFDPYIVFLTEEQKSKLQIKTDTNISGIESDLSEKFLVHYNDIEDEIFNIGRPADCPYFFYGYALNALSEIVKGSDLQPDSYIKITITYDGVDYVYLS